MTHFLPDVLSELIRKKKATVPIVGFKQNYAHCQKCEQLPRSQPRCGADVPCLFSLHQTWKRGAAVIWTAAVRSVSAWTAAVAGVRSEWIAGPAA